jgi:hypothetical protein
MPEFAFAATRAPIKENQLFLLIKNETQTIAAKTFSTMIWHTKIQTRITPRYVCCNHDNESKKEKEGEERRGGTREKGEQE